MMTGFVLKGEQMYDWSDDAALCGNCKHWALQSYQYGTLGSPPCGNGNHEFSGECRLNAPAHQGGGLRSAVWPATDRTDYCGQFAKRTKPFRRQREERRATDITGAPLTTEG